MPHMSTIKFIYWPFILWLQLIKCLEPNYIDLPFHHRRLECKSRKSRDTWSNRQIWPWVQNKPGERLREFCQENALVIANTLFQQQKRRLYTWTSPDGQIRKPTYDPEIPLLGICPGETTIERDTCTPVFIAALFTIARTRKQPSCPSTGEWIKKCGIYTQWNILLSYKKEHIWVSSNEVYEPRIYYTEWSESEREK